jgi:Xaa-Pro aminopeptidase
MAKGNLKKKPRLRDKSSLYRARLKRLQSLLRDPLVITRPEHIFWLGGFTGTSGAICVTRTDACFVTDPRYAEQARHELAPGIRCVTAMERPERIIAKQSMLKGEARLYLEEEAVSIRDIVRWRDALPGLEVLMRASPITSLRLIKEPEEVAAIRSSLALAEEALAWIAPFVRPGVREIELAARLEYYARMKGASRAAFNLIVASGPNSAKPHGVAGTRIVQENEPVQFDIGFICEGYCSDLSRVLFCGNRPPAALRRMYAFVEEAQAVGKAFIRAGLPAGLADLEVRAFFKEKGVLRQYLHTLGHGLGLEIHEAPRLSHKEQGILEAGMVVTLEPGLYRAGKYGVRLEDVLLITQSGNEVLTDFPCALACIPCR